MNRAQEFAEKQRKFSEWCLERFLETEHPYAPSPSDSVNVVDGLCYIAEQLSDLVRAVTPSITAYGEDATGGTIGSLTEAVMGITAGLVRVAESIQNLAEAVENRE